MTSTGARLLLTTILTWGLCLSLLAGADRAQGAGAAGFTLTVLDQHGQPREGAKVAVYERIGDTEQAGPRVLEAFTGPGGSAQLDLDPALRYIVHIMYSEFVGSEENWVYGYIDPWNWPGRAFQRTYPWLDEVTVPAGAHPVGELLYIDVAVRHGYEFPEFDQPIRIHMIIDDDGAPPFLEETDSESQPLAVGQIRFRLGYTPLTAGHYLVRLRTDSRWELQPWFNTDDGGWQWSFDVGAPTPTPSPTPTSSSTTTPTATPTPTPGPCMVGGIVFEDLDRDGLREPDSPGVAGVEVLLCTREGQTLQRTLTDTSGAYRFERVGMSSYRIFLGSTPAGYRWTDLAYEVGCRDGLVFPSLDFPLVIWRSHLPLVLKPT